MGCPSVGFSDHPPGTFYYVENAFLDTFLGQMCLDQCWKNKKPSETLDRNSQETCPGLSWLPMTVPRTVLRAPRRVLGTSPGQSWELPISPELSWGAPRTRGRARDVKQPGSSRHHSPLTTLRKPKASRFFILAKKWLQETCAETLKKL